MGNWAICNCRDAEGKLQVVAAPWGVAHEGAYLRLLGGVIVRVEKVIVINVSLAVEVLESVWVEKL